VPDRAQCAIFAPNQTIMFGRVKKWLGIEGVKLELIIPEKVSARDGVVEGKVRFHSMNPQQVTYIKAVLIEKYSRGRGKDRRVDEYELGAIELKENIDIPANEPLEIEFSLPFSLVKSDMDELAEKNPLLGGAVRAARLLGKVRSEYFLQAEAKVRGTALDPFDKKSLLLR
jgi:hypothetical protein